jgi:hypothetical protein
MRDGTPGVNTLTGTTFGLIAEPGSAIGVRIDRRLAGSGDHPGCARIGSQPGSQ